MNAEAERIVRTIAEAHLVNHSEVASAFVEERPLPPLVLKTGFTIFHSDCDPVAALFGEIYHQNIYTTGDFYVPAAGEVVLDCGANIGMFAIFLLSLQRRLRIHCFEPSVSTRARLIHNLTVNELSEVSVYPYALWSTKSSLRLRPASSSGDFSIFERETNSTAVEPEMVEAIPLAEALKICRTPEVDLLKLDVEGAEAEILEGAAEVDWAHVHRVAVEYHDFVRPGSRRRVLESLRRYGFDRINADANPDLGIIRAARSARQTR